MNVRARFVALGGGLALIGCVGLKGGGTDLALDGGLSVMLPDVSGTTVADTTSGSKDTTSEVVGVDIRVARDVGTRPDAAPDVGPETSPDASDPWQCATVDNCAQLDDPTGCGGVHYCDDATGKCVLATNTVIDCVKNLAYQAPEHPCEVAVCIGPPGKCVWKPVPDGKTCDDFDACTSGEKCVGGTCKAGTWDKSLCECLKTADCAKYNSADLCKPTWFCNLVSGKCQPNPATETTCAWDDPDVCHYWQCNPKSGKCEQLVHLGKPCEDGDFCSADTVCKADGTCGDGKVTCACFADTDCAGKNGGNACIGTFYCDFAQGGICVLNPATPVTCPTVNNTSCRVNSCNPKTGSCEMVDLPDTTTCDADGEACTVGDHCEAGTCTAGVMDSACACFVDADCAGQGNLCDGTFFCDKVQHVCVLNPATQVTCPSVLDTQCRKNTCDAATGQCALVDLPDGTTCDADGQSCTVGDHCTAGTCVVGSKDPACVCMSQDDCVGMGDKCNGTYYCDLSTHQCLLSPATPVYCSPGSDTACVKATCNPANGQCIAKTLPSGTPCDDMNACTAGDMCQGSVCVGQSICECIVDGDCAGVPWANPCVGQVGCLWQGGIRKCAFVPGTAPTCAQLSDPCAANTCDPAIGKCVAQQVADNTKCQGADPCFVGQFCKSGSCQGGGNLCECATDTDCLQWEDGNLCNGLPYCDLTTWYGAGLTPHPCAVHKTLQVTCQPDSGCTSSVCDPPTGTCVLASVPCDDGEPCTADACNGSQCSHTPLADKLPCVDVILGGNGVCVGGTCHLP